MAFLEKLTAERTRCWLGLRTTKEPQEVGRRVRWARCSLMPLCLPLFASYSAITLPPPCTSHLCAGGLERGVSRGRLWGGQLWGNHLAGFVNSFMTHLSVI